MRPKTRNLPVPTDEEILSMDNVPVEVAARYIGSSTATLYEALQDERTPFGWAVQGAQWRYNISPGALVRYKRGELPMYRLKDVSEIITLEVGRMIDAKMQLVGKVAQAIGGL